MSSRRAPLSPADATNEGARRLRELARRQSFRAIAKKLGCNETAVRFWAQEKYKPSGRMRERINARLGPWDASPWSTWPDDVWESAPCVDVYSSETPATERRAPMPSTKPRPS